ncbi:MAG: DUF2079 domain-containing protein, partial [Candidatus Saccharimonadales bacterium]
WFIPSFFILSLIMSACLWSSYADQQFSYLAQAFLHGHLNLAHLYPSSSDDLVYSGHRIYWALGPFPAVVLMPFVLTLSIFGGFFLQGYLQSLLVLAVLGMVFLLARNFKYDKEDSLILALGFVLGSTFIGVAAISFSWYFAQVITVLLLFWALYEYFNRKRWWLIGLICAMLLLTRVDAAAILVFFTLELVRSKRKIQEKRRLLALLFATVVAAALLLGAYNFLRFHDVLNQGYSMQVLYPAVAGERAHGLLNPGHIPTNFYYAFIHGPMPVFKTGTHELVYPYVQNDPWGMSIFLTSPYLLYLFTLKRRELKGWPLNLLITASVICIFLLAWFATGYFQFGWRFSLDFLPLLFVLFMAKYRQRHERLSTSMRLLLLGSGAFNFYLMMWMIVMKTHIAFLGL